jgi:hypothetical protein
MWNVEKFWGTKSIGSVGIKMLKNLFETQRSKTIGDI